jgi:Uma2 family endonuclease
MAEPALKMNFVDERNHELIDGRVVIMANQGIAHADVIMNIFNLFDGYTKENKYRIFTKNIDIFLTEKDLFVPDVAIVCNTDIVKQGGVHGAPDLVIEVLSPSTVKNDKIYKKEVYGSCGVKEYWLVSIESRYLEVFLLKDGKLTLDNVYSIYPEWMLNSMSADEKNKIVTGVKSSLFPDINILIEEIFHDIFHEINI